MSNFRNMEMKLEFREQLARMFALNESLEEVDVKEENPDVYEEGMALYGDWKKALYASGVKKKKQLERKRFMLYMLMKNRFEKYGEEALKHKNIEAEKKAEIVEVFKTVKALTQIVRHWSAEKVLFETRAYMLSGGLFENLEKEEPKLYARAMEYFEDTGELKQAYDSSFSIASVSEENEAEEESTNDYETKYKNLIRMLNKMGYMEEENADSFVSAVDIERSEVVSYLLEEAAKLSREGKRITEEHVKETKPEMYYAAKMYFENIQNAVQAAIKAM